MTFNTQVGSIEGLVDEQQPQLESIHSMTTTEWRAKYEKDGTVDLWVEEEFNAGSRLVVSSGHRGTHVLKLEATESKQPVISLAA